VRLQLTCSPALSTLLFNSLLTQAPLDYSKPQGQQIDLWLTRIHPANESDVLAEMWALQGGPGTPGTGLAG